MKTAIAVWQDRIAPVFDVAGTILVFENNGSGENTFPQEREILVKDPADRVLFLNSLKINVLICGAVSKDLSKMITDSGIQLIPFTAGNAEEIYTAYLNGKLPSARHTMPGCGRKRRFRGGRMTR